MSRPLALVPMLMLLAAPAWAGDLSASSITLRTVDQWTLVGDYRPPLKGRDVVVLIHSLNGTRREWGLLQDRLRTLGLGTLAFDLRGFGESTRGPGGLRTFHTFTDQDWLSTTKDVGAAIAFLRQQGIPQERIALAGSMLGANIASTASAVYPHLAWMILFSPSNDYHGLGAGLGGVQNILLAAGMDDGESMALCRNLMKIDPSRTFYIANARGQGIGMLNDKTFLDEVMGWVRRTMH